MSEEIFEDGYYVFSWPNGSGSSELIPRIKGKWSGPYLRNYHENTPVWESEVEVVDPYFWESGYEYRPATQDEINHYKICKEFDRYVGEGYYVLDYNNGTFASYLRLDADGILVGNYVDRSNDAVIRTENRSISNWLKSEHRTLEPMSEDRIKWFNKCLKEDKVLDFPLMSESERQVAEGEIVLGKIYFKDDTWYLPEETSDGVTFGGPFLMLDYKSDRRFVKYEGGKNSFEFTSKKPEELEEDHEDYSWIKYCFDNETNISKEEWEEMFPKIEIGKVYEVTYNSSKSQCLVLVDRLYNKSFKGDYFYSLSSSPQYSTKGVWWYDCVTFKLVEDQEYWLANFENKEISNTADLFSLFDQREARSIAAEINEEVKYKYSDVVYDLESMDYTPPTQLADVFIWNNSPQGYDYWRKVDLQGHTEESKYYLAQMKAQYEKSQQDQSPQETRDWLGESLTIDQLRGKLFDINEQSSRYWGIVCDKESEIRILKQEIDDLNNKLSESKIMKFIRKIV